MKEAEKRSRAWWVLPERYEDIHVNGLREKLRKKAVFHRAIHRCWRLMRCATKIHGNGLMIKRRCKTEGTASHLVVTARPKERERNRERYLLFTKSLNPTAHATWNRTNLIVKILRLIGRIRFLKYNVSRNVVTVPLSPDWGTLKDDLCLIFLTLTGATCNKTMFIPGLTVIDWLSGISGRGRRSRFRWPHFGDFKSFWKVLLARLNFYFDWVASIHCHIPEGGAKSESNQKRCWSCDWPTISYFQEFFKRTLQNICKKLGIYWKRWSKVSLHISKIWKSTLRKYHGIICKLSNHR